MYLFAVQGYGRNSLLICELEVDPPELHSRQFLIHIKDDENDIAKVHNRNK